MSTIIPEGQGIRKAIEWIEQERKDRPEKKTLQLIDSAGMRFNLAPNATEFLVRFYQEKSRAS
ncbi:MAG: hypothetical protein KKD44_12095 [Proteobacteria bacterium]|nr:hypothetical protein [Pseudomonadota bacterium]